MKPPLVVFTDLDGCLLDRRTYEWQAAEAALGELRALDIPLVLCSSKTRAEVEVHRAAVAPGDPFIVENGGALFIPEGYFPFSHAVTRTEGPYQVVEFGIRYPRLVRLFRDIRQRTRLSLCGFSEMSVSEVSFFTGLDEEAAARAKAREYDEPFTAALTPEEEARVDLEARRCGLTLTRGGRFFHLTAGHDKGRAAAFLARLYRTRWPGIETVGLGDAANDLSLLVTVDHPIVIPREPGVVDAAFVHRDWPVAPAPGPEGWNAAVLALLRQRGTATRPSGAAHPPHPRSESWRA